MTGVYYVHWNADELAERASVLSAVGITVANHATIGQTPNFPDPAPIAVVISVDRLPSHGREVAEWVVQAKPRRSIPLLLEGGAVEKVVGLRALFPQAVFYAKGVFVASLPVP